LKFGDGIDASAAGRRGGQASVLSRRLRKQRQLEAKVLESRNGAAAVKLLEIEMRRERELEHERRRMDERVRQADQTLERLTDWREQEEQRLAELRAQCDELRRTVETGEGLVELLRVAHDRGLLEDALRALDLFEEVPDYGAVASQA
jgi:hypothetical protein